MNAFQSQGQKRRDMEARRRKFAALQQEHAAAKRRFRLMANQQSALQAKADSIWLNPRGKNGLSMNRALLRLHWTARGMTGEMMEVAR
jgi:hypothetical protein